MELLILKLGLALAIGLLVGLERGWREREAPAGSRTAGIRTYSISGLLGGVFAALAQAFDDASVFLVGFLGFAFAFAWFKFREAEHDDDFSVTGVIAALSVFALGGLAVAGDYRAASAGGAALAAVLASREVLHGLVKRLSWIELRSALMLAVMTAVGLPLLPDRAIDPWGGFNPWEVWFFTVLTAAISYLGYIAVKVLGSAKGLLVSGLAGALVSSTAVTVAFARTAKAGGNPRPLSGAAALAAMVSVLRVMTVVLVIQPQIIRTVGPAALAAAAAFACEWPGADRPLDRQGQLRGVGQKSVRSGAAADICGAVCRRLDGKRRPGGHARQRQPRRDVGTFRRVRCGCRRAQRATHGWAGRVAGDCRARRCSQPSPPTPSDGSAWRSPPGPIAYWLPLVAATALAAGCGFAAYVLVPQL